MQLQFRLKTCRLHLRYIPHVHVQKEIMFIVKVYIHKKEQNSYHPYTNLEFVKEKGIPYMSKWLEGFVLTQVCDWILEKILTSFFFF